MLIFYNRWKLFQNICLTLCLTRSLVRLGSRRRASEFRSVHIWEFLFDGDGDDVESDDEAKATFPLTCVFSISFHSMSSVCPTGWVGCIVQAMKCVLTETCDDVSTYLKLQIWCTDELETDVHCSGRFCRTILCTTWQFAWLVILRKVGRRVLLRVQCSYDKGVVLHRRTLLWRAGIRACEVFLVLSISIMSLKLDTWWFIAN